MKEEAHNKDMCIPVLAFYIFGMIVIEQNVLHLRLWE